MRKQTHMCVFPLLDSYRIVNMLMLLHAEAPLNLLVAETMFVRVSKTRFSRYQAHVGNQIVRTYGFALQPLRTWLFTYLHTYIHPARLTQLLTFVLSLLVGLQV